MLSLLFCIWSIPGWDPEGPPPGPPPGPPAEDDRPCIRVEVCEGGKLVLVQFGALGPVDPEAGLFIRHEVLDGWKGGGGGVTRMASSP